MVFGPAPLWAANSPLGVFPPTTNQPPSGLQIVTGWNPSPDTTVVGYYLGWGLASGQCTNLIEVGNVTTATLGGLATNVPYYFTVVAHDALDQRAPPSNEIQFIGSNAATLIPPMLVLDLTNQNAALGSTVEFAVAATGDAPLSYIWFFNGLRLTTTSSNVLDIAGLTLQQGGQYQVIITNSAGSVTSSIATLTVLLPPRIDSDLVSQTVCAGSNVTFQVAASGTGPLSYQWLCNDTNLSGAQGNYVAFNNVSQKQSGTYQVIVSNAVGLAASSPA